MHRLYTETILDCLDLTIGSMKEWSVLKIEERTLVIEFMEEKHYEAYKSLIGIINAYEFPKAIHIFIFSYNIIHYISLIIIYSIWLLPCVYFVLLYLLYPYTSGVWRWVE